MRRSEAIAMGRALHGTFPILPDSVVANGCPLAYVEKRGSSSLDFAALRLCDSALNQRNAKTRGCKDAKNEKSFFSVSFKKPQRTQRTQQLSVPSASSVVNLLCHTPSTQKKLKSHTDSLLIDHGGI